MTIYCGVQSQRQRDQQRRGEGRQKRALHRSSMADAQEARKRKLAALKAKRQQSNQANAALVDQEESRYQTGPSFHSPFSLCSSRLRSPILLATCSGLCLCASAPPGVVWVAHAPELLACV